MSHHEQQITVQDGTEGPDAAVERTLAAELAPLRGETDGARRRVWGRVQARMAEERGARRGLPGWRRGLALGAAGLLLALAVVVGAVGPERAWAEVVRMLGYVPGIGFANLEGALALDQPVAATRDGVTLRVEQALATPRRTTVVIRSEGPGLPEPASSAEPPEARLRLPDGRALEVTAFSLNIGAGRLAFPPLPEGVREVTLELARLPFAPPGAAPEDWSVPLALRPLTGDPVADALPQPYAPEGATHTLEGVTLDLLDAAHTADETALRLRVSWEDPAWRFLSLGFSRELSLRDDLGHTYSRAHTLGQAAGVVARQAPGAAGEDAAAGAHVETLRFAPGLQPSGGTLPGALTLLVDGLAFALPVDGAAPEAGFSLDLGENPQAGEAWPLDATLDVEGFEVRVTGAELVEEVIDLNDGGVRRVALQFALAPVPEEGRRRLEGLLFDADAAGFSGSSSGYDYAANRLRAGLTLQEGEEIPRGVVRIGVREARVSLRGPWEVTWPVPGAEKASP